jgi:hypothetical protein
VPTAADTKTVYVLGAGASIDVSSGAVPGIRGLFAAAVRHHVLAPDRYPGLLHYARERFNVDLWSPENTTDAEELLTSLEFDYELTDSPRYAVAKQQAIDALSRTIRQVQSVEKPHFTTLVRLLQPYDSIVTFNWDTMCDTAAERTPQFQTMLNDVLGYSKWNPENMGPELPLPYRDYAPGLYIKAHGSVDWFRCTNKICPLHGNSYRITQPRDDLVCKHCHEEVTVHIVPPVTNKRIVDDPPVRRAWALARRELLNAESVVIWGYSMPPSDFAARWLLRQAGQRAFGTTVSLIDPATKQPDFANRFREAFSKYKLNCYENFEEWHAAATPQNHG